MILVITLSNKIILFMAIESLNEECGVFGIYNPSEPVAESIYLGLFALQHRGQESAGIATSNHEEIFYKKLILD